MTDYTPIRVRFSTDDIGDFTFTATEPLQVKFKVYYKRPRLPKFLGDGYTGDRLANERL